MNIEYTGDFQAAIQAFSSIAATLTNMWGAIKRWIYRLRRHGTRYERRYAWKMLHPVRRWKIKRRLKQWTG